MNAQPGISGRTFALVAVLIVVSLGITIWYSIPGPDTRHDLRSPSGRALLQIGENCDETGCDRVVIYESTAADGTKVRTGCPMEIAGTAPVFVTVTADWSADELEVTLRYADAVGKAGTLSLLPANDCTLTGG